MFLIQERKSNNAYLKSLSEKNPLESYNFQMHLNCAYDLLSTLIPGLDWHLPRHCWLNEWLHWVTAERERWVGAGDRSVCFPCTLFYRIDPYMKAKLYSFWKPVQWKPQNWAYSLLAFSWTSEESQLHWVRFAPVFIHDYADSTILSEVAGVTECGGQSSHFWK